MEGSKARNKETGDIGENVACIFLRRKGFSVIATKVRASWCEIDIIAEKDSVVHFVEVKSITGENMPGSYRPEELVHHEKLHKISRFAEFYMNKANDGRDFQIDVVGVFLNKRLRRAQCRITENVFL
jgi:putative endonuclease